jgi:hypothetical protein
LPQYHSAAQSPGQSVSVAVSARKIIALDQTGFTGSGLICNNFVFFVLFVVKRKPDGH